MGTVDANGIYMYEDTDPLVPFASLLNTGQASVSAAFDNVDTQVIHYVANEAERTTLASEYAPTSSKPLFVYRGNAPTGAKIEYTTNGTAWNVDGLITKSDRKDATANGSLNGSVAVGPSITVPANPYGATTGFQVRGFASIRVGVPAGLGAVLTLSVGGATIAEDRFTNGGTSANTVTLGCTGALLITNPVAAGPVVVSATVASLAGAITVNSTLGYIEAEVQARVAL